MLNTSTVTEEMRPARANSLAVITRFRTLGTLGEEDGLSADRLKDMRLAGIIFRPQPTEHTTQDNLICWKHHVPYLTNSYLDTMLHLLRRLAEAAESH